jgi:hypothetical protein
MTTIQIPLAEYEKLKADAERWVTFNQRMAKGLSPANTAWKLVEVCPMYGEEKEIRDWRGQIDAAIKQKGGA